MLKRRQINADPGRSSVLAALAAAARSLRSLGWGIEERAWDWGRRLGKVMEPVRWPLERAAFFVEERILWPLQEHAEENRPKVSGQLAGTVAVVALAVGVVALAVLSLQGDEEGELRTGQPAPVAFAPVPTPEPSPVAGEPVLRGAPPSFEVEGAGAADSASAETVSSGSVEDLEDATGEETATSSSSKPAPAGPAAMKVARRFADAFVNYEVGEKKERVEQIFAETATPQLASALAERPPRQPASVDVPQARVLNLVPGPRRGRTYTVSAALLRIGTTSELRLEMKKRNGNWVITDVRG